MSKHNGVIVAAIGEPHAGPKYGTIKDTLNKLRAWGRTPRQAAETEALRRPHSTRRKGGAK